MTQYIIQFKNKTWYPSLKAHNFINSNMPPTLTTVTAILSCIGINHIGTLWKISSGRMMGRISLLGTPGYIWRTPVVDLVVGGRSVFETDMSSNIQRFCLQSDLSMQTREHLYKQCQQYISKNEPVIIHFDQYVSYWPWKSGSNYIVRAIEPVTKH